MIGWRLIGLFGAFLGGALIASAPAIALLMLSGGRRFDLTPRQQRGEDILVRVVGWWVRLVGAAFVVVGCAYIVAPQLAK